MRVVMMVRRMMMMMICMIMINGTMRRRRSSRSPGMLFILDAHGRRVHGILRSKRVCGHLDAGPGFRPTWGAFLTWSLARTAFARAGVFEPPRRNGHVAYSGYHVNGVQAVKGCLAKVCSWSCRRQQTRTRRVSLTSSVAMGVRLHLLRCHFRVTPRGRSSGSDTCTLNVCLMRRSTSDLGLPDERGSRLLTELERWFSSVENRSQVCSPHDVCPVR